jgi:nucleoside-diphosphate-sugar epimerase
MDALVQAAAAYRYERSAAASMANNAPLARTILEAARDAGTAKVVDVSSQVVFALGQSPVNEDARLAGPGDRGWADPYLRSKVEAEHVGRELEAAGLPRVTVYPGIVIGPEDTAMARERAHHERPHRRLVDRQPGPWLTSAMSPGGSCWRWTGLPGAATS